MFSDDSAERTVFVRGLDERVTKELLEELFTQMGNVNRVVIKEQQPGNRYAFVEFQDEESVLFAIEMLDEVELFGRPIRIAPRDNTKQYQLYLQKKPQFVPKNVERRGGGGQPQPSQPLPYMRPYQFQQQGRVGTHLPPPPQPQHAHPMMEPVRQQPSCIAHTYEPLFQPSTFGQSWPEALHHPVQTQPQQQTMSSAPRGGAGPFPPHPKPQQQGVFGRMVRQQLQQQQRSRQQDRKGRDGWGSFWSGQVPDGNWRGGAAGGPSEQHQPPQQHPRGGGASSGGRPSQQPWRGRGGGGRGR